MSSQVHASRSQHNLRSQYSSSRPSGSSSHRNDHSRYDEYGQRQPSSGHHQRRHEQDVGPPRSLRAVASSSRLPREIRREEMPPPALPSQRQRPPPSHAPTHASSHPQQHRQPRQQAASIPYAPSTNSRHETYDRVPSQRPPLAVHTATREARPTPRHRDSDRCDDQHQAVLDRMRQNGWHGVGGGGGSPSSQDGMSQRSNSSSSSSLDPNEYRQSADLAKVDSGYAEEIDAEDKTAGEKVLEGWSALKKAVAGLAGEGAANNGQGARMWNRLTTTLAASVGTVQDAWNTEDDGSIGPDGETKLGRAIKSYHLSRVESVDDHARSTGEFAQPQSSRERPPARQYHSEERLPSHGQGMGQGSRTLEGGGAGGGPGGGVSRGSAADRLARMREERRMRANAV
ncbi:uncharacterized protein JCM6883_003775 [Sporobolomyces salmoneus]|uniref:uncharacterized protein n=1 Tax=Sporobolomyces salmoneus TaxID=183962 RepID=UPI00316B9E22